MVHVPTAVLTAYVSTFPCAVTAFEVLDKSMSDGLYSYLRVHFALLQCVIAEHNKNTALPDVDINY